MDVIDMQKLKSCNSGNQLMASEMTMRDYFAAKALQGICSSGPDRSWTDAMLACEAYRLADAMLQERSK